jgi:acyl-CoA-dependent ceramide synthase
MHYEIACNIAFGLFVITWFISRHVMYLKLCWDIYTDVPGPTTMAFGCYNGATNKLLDMPAQPDYLSHLFWPFQDLDGAICLNTEVKYIFLGMLLLLHTLSMIWFGMILKIIGGVLIGGKAEDTRSDDEGEETELKIEDLNVCVGGGSDISGEMLGTSTIASPKTRPTTVRRRLMDAENRKELLARIGCEKPI